MLYLLARRVSNFYPRPPGGGRPEEQDLRLAFLSISIHALRVEGDQTSLDEKFELLISIHALRVEGDRTGHIHTRRTNYFYPRPPGGGRLRDLENVQGLY